MRKLFFIILMQVTALALNAKDVEITGKVVRETLANKEVLILITDSNEKYEITGKLLNFIRSFYINQQIRVLGTITKNPSGNQEGKLVDGKIEVKEVIVR